MAKYGKDMIVYPLSTQKVQADLNFRIYTTDGGTKYTIKLNSDAIKITDDNETEPYSHCLKAIRALNDGTAEYAMIELFAKDKQVQHMNVAHLTIEKS